MVRKIFISYLTENMVRSAIVVFRVNSFNYRLGGRFQCQILKFPPSIIDYLLNLQRTKERTTKPEFQDPGEFVTRVLYQDQVMSTNHEAINTINVEFISGRTDYTGNGEYNVNNLPASPENTDSPHCSLVGDKIITYYPLPHQPPEHIRQIEKAPPPTPEHISQKEMAQLLISN